MNVQMQGTRLAMMPGAGGLDSTRQRQERQAQRDSEVAFFEKQKENLKNMGGDSLEDISRKIELLHSYEEQIAAIKEKYNSQEVFHVLDEAQEFGEKIAEAAAKNEPNTAEERREDMVEEALGTDENKGELTEELEELTELTEELTEEMTEELEEQTTEQLEQLEQMDVPAEGEAESAVDAMGNRMEELAEAEQLRRYHPFDMRV